VKWVVFSGPTATPDEMSGALHDADFRGPAACGDVVRACADGAGGILLVDGYFEHRLAVWHKEILWALAQGIRVYGAASIGALRAIELQPFGMVGVGQVYRWFRDGILEDDDEVAIVHEPAERRYRPASEALVNIRATLARAIECEALAPRVAAVLMTQAKEMHFPMRTFRALLLAGAQAQPQVDWQAFERWLERERVDIKKHDALAAAQRVQRDRQLGPGPSDPRFHFEYTEAWHQLVTRLRRSPAS
jgi:hypothetical protein